MRPVGAGEFAERAFDLAHVGRDLALDDHFGIGRNHEVLAPGLRRHQPDRLVHHGAQHLVIVGAERRHVERAEVERWMMADDDDDSASAGS